MRTVIANDRLASVPIARLFAGPSRVLPNPPLEDYRAVAFPVDRPPGGHLIHIRLAIVRLVFHQIGMVDVHASLEPLPLVGLPSLTLRIQYCQDLRSLLAQTWRMTRMIIVGGVQAQDFGPYTCLRMQSWRMDLCG